MDIYVLIFIVIILVALIHLVVNFPNIPLKEFIYPSRKLYPRSVDDEWYNVE